MTRLQTELTALIDRIDATHPEAKHRFHSQLSALIDRMDASGERVPPQARHLAEDLVNDAIEAQFDNMPV